MFAAQTANVRRFMATATTPSAPPEVPELIIEAGRAERQYWRDLWRYRELFYFLAWRDILVRYKQTAIGVAWALVRPLLTTLVFTVIYSKVAGLPAAGNVPYALMVFAAMLPWQFFATSLSEASNSLIGNANLISKVYFPRLIVPASAVITSLVDYGISFAILLGMMLWYRFFSPPAGNSSRCHSGPPGRSWPRSGRACTSPRST